LMAVGVHDIANAIEELRKSAKESGGDVNLMLARALRKFQEVVKGNGRGV